MYNYILTLFPQSPDGSAGKESTSNAGDTGDIKSLSQDRFPGEGKQPALVFLPGKSHGQKSLAGCSP